MILGKVALTFGGDYSSSREYEKLVCVTYNGASYVSIREVPEGILPTNIQYWQVISSRGAQGPQGIPGPQGNSAFDGEGIEIVNNLVDGGEVAVLSAEQGKLLNAKVAQLDQEWQEIKDSDFTLNPHIEKVDLTGTTAATIEPDKFYIFGEVAALSVTFAAGNARYASQYAFQFTSPADNPTSLALPVDINFTEAPEIKANKIYQVSVVEKLAIVTEWSR